MTMKKMGRRMRKKRRMTFFRVGVIVEIVEVVEAAGGGVDVIETSQVHAVLAFYETTAWWWESACVDGWRNWKDRGMDGKMDEWMDG